MIESPTWILLATYDGERFLRRQLASLFAQTDRNWRLLVRDDGSSDRTPALLGAAAAADARVRVVDDDGGRLGSSRNFFRLMHAALAEGADYFAFCDQDDIWQPDKLATLRAALRAGERAAAPCLVYSDLSWIDARGDEIARSHFRASCGGMPEQDHRWLMAMNLIPGCAMLGNRALLECALRRMDLAHHDWWVALAAAAMGELVRVAPWANSCAWSVPCLPIACMGATPSAPARCLPAASVSFCGRSINWHADTRCTGPRWTTRARCLSPRGGAP